MVPRFVVVVVVVVGAVVVGCEGLAVAHAASTVEPTAAQAARLVVARKPTPELF
jgi:hypothetical protein